MGRYSDDMKKDGLVILWIGCSGWEAFDGTLEEAIASVKGDRRYADYGDDGAIIVKAQRLYSIKLGPIEKTYPEA